MEEKPLIPLLTKMRKVPNPANTVERGCFESFFDSMFAISGKEYVRDRRLDD